MVTSNKDKVSGSTIKSVSHNSYILEDSCRTVIGLGFNSFHVPIYMSVIEKIMMKCGI